MRNVFMWSVGVCTLCATLAQAQTPRSDRAPDGRSFLPVDEKQSVNQLAPRPGRYSFSETPEARYLLPEPSVRRIAEEKAGKYAADALDPRSLGRDLRESAPLHNRAFARPDAGEKANVLPESAETHHLTAPSAPRKFMPEEQPVKMRYFVPQSERH